MRSSRSPETSIRPCGRLAAFLVLAVAAAGCAPSHRNGDAARFVTSAACASCHPAEYAAWTGSDHERAMQVASDSTVLGDFGDVTFTSRGVTTRFFRRGAAFMVGTEGPDGRPAEYEVRYTFGVEPLQQYLVVFPRGRLQALQIAWDTRRGRWFSLYPDEHIAPGDPLHWTGPYFNWNAQCADCHSTHLRKNYDFDTDAYATSWSDVNVGCEACHGAGGRHVAWAEQSARTGRKVSDPGLPAALTGADGPRQVEVCAPCHARRLQITDAREPGDPLFDHFVPVRLDQGLYFPDGQIQDEVYVYGSFVQSRMYAAGVRCSDCHDPHALRPVAEGNALCTRCHGETPDPRFPMLKAGRYDTPDHHFHEPGTPGSMCVNCHMPQRTYMVVDPRRDHSFKVPRPDLTETLGTPNPCAACHARSAAWAAAEIRKRHGASARGSFAQAIAAGRAHSPGAGPALARLAADTTRPAIVRATALELLEPGDADGEPVERAALDDASPLVRVAAVRGLEQLDARPRVEALAPLLEDPRRAVRIEAARVLAAVPRTTLDPASVRAFDRALAEYVEAQEINRDVPSGNMNLALIHEAQGRDDLAEESYRAALEKDPAFMPARFNLVHLYNRTGRNQEAERVLRDGLELAPENGEFHYSLGLLLAEERRLEESAVELARAEELLPGEVRVKLNHGLALQHLGRGREAEQAFQRALRLDGNDLDVLAALCILHVQEGRWAPAQREAERMLEIDPSDPRGRQLLARIPAGKSSP